MINEMRSVIKKKQRKRRLKGIGRDAYDEVLGFCKSQQILRDGWNCSNYLNGKYSPKCCQDIIDDLFDKNRMGAYSIDNGDPQIHMKSEILRLLPDITTTSRILEIGPGNLPLFYEDEYPNWIGLDYNLKEGVIHFSGKEWGKNKYRNIYKGSWESITEDCKKNNINLGFDLVCGCHSFEHNHKPVKALREAASALKKGGYIVIFVPDVYSTWRGNYDKTHTLYMDRAMTEDLFSAAGGFEEVSCEQFRTNMDLIIMSRKKSDF